MAWLRSRWVITAGLAILLAAVLTSVSLVARGGPSSPRAALAQTQVQQTEAEGVHGGPKPRFHDGDACPLPAGAKLQGNWTHGDYVTAWAEADETKVRDAAHSACGKPAHVAKRKAGKADPPGKSVGRKKATGQG